MKLNQSQIFAMLIVLVISFGGGYVLSGIWSMWGYPISFVAGAVALYFVGKQTKVIK
jgi:hypothetical protein